MDKALNIHQRIAACMDEVDYIQREKKQGMQYTVTSHDKVTAKVRPVLLKNGVIYYPLSIESEQSGNRTQVKLTVRFANIDNPGDCIDVPSLGYGIDTQDKGPGKAISYAVKYALLKALGLETGDDPDTDAETPPHGPDPQEVEAAQKRADDIIAKMHGCTTLEELGGLWKALWQENRAIAERKDVTKAKDEAKAKLEAA